MLILFFLMNLDKCWSIFYPFLKPFLGFINLFCYFSFHLFHLSFLWSLLFPSLCWLWVLFVLLHLIFLPGKSRGGRNLTGDSPRGRKESGTTGNLFYFIFFFSLSNTSRRQVRLYIWAFSTKLSLGVSFAVSHKFAKLCCHLYLS